MPSVDEANERPYTSPLIATNRPFPKATEYQFCALGSEHVVQLMPSDEIAAVFVSSPEEFPKATATNTPFP
jgi:hypothetical protein